MLRRLSSALVWNPRSKDRGLLRALFLWNPLVALGFDVTFGGTHDLLRRWATSLVIADTVTVICFGLVVGARLVEQAIHRRRGTAPKERSVAWYFGASALLLPIALPVGLWAGARFGVLLGEPYHVPDLHNYRLGLAFGAIATMLFFLHHSRREARDAALAAEARIRELENANLRAKLAALTAEMNPHMLFNALNTIASLIPEDPERAEETVVELAELYRGILRTSGASTHPLADELRLCEAYLRVERARFRDRLTIEVDLDPTLDAEAVHVPVLLLQPLVENAVKHGIAPRARGGTIALRVRRSGARITATVEDDGVGLGRSAIKGAGRALSNCHDRLRLAYGEGAELAVVAREGGGTRARLSLPSRPLAVEASP